jgi:hypothetical protein
MRSILNSRYLYGRLNEMIQSLVNWSGWEHKGVRIIALILAAAFYWLSISIDGSHVADVVFCGHLLLCDVSSQIPEL